MQDYKCTSITPNTTIALRDTRDDQSYTVYRFPNSGTAGTDYPTGMAGYCLMTKDLSLGYITNGSITKDSNLVLTTTDSAGSGTITARTSTSNWSSTNADSNLQYINGAGGAYDSHSYYSYGAAQKVCPKGWKLFTQTQVNNIIAFMGSGTAGVAKIEGAPYNFIRGGYFMNSSGWTNIEVSSHYWSSTQYDSSKGYDLYYNPTDFYTSYKDGKQVGFSVRCIAEPAMQDWTGCSALSVGKQDILVDKRDSHSYTVKKLPDGKCWMTQNLTLGDSNSTSAQRTLTSELTNIDDSTTYYLPPAGKQGSSTITTSSTLTATTTANFGTSNDNRAKTRFRTKSSSITNDSDTVYYSFYTATLGYSYYMTSGSGAGKSYGSSTRDICPKGWRLPWVSDDGEATDASGDFDVLARSYNPSATWTGDGSDKTTTDATIRTGIHLGLAADGNSYAGFSYTGYWNKTNSSATSIGDAGYYLSSSIKNVGFGLGLIIDSSYVYHLGGIYKYHGAAVRCIAKS